MRILHTVRLKKNEERRILAGHSWVFSNEIHGDLRGLEPGELVRVVSRSDSFLGVGPVNPNSLISIRLLTRGKQTIDADFYRHRLVVADQRRQMLYPGVSTYRMVFSESDFLPGLMIDRYDHHLTVQILTQGMARVEDLLLDLLIQEFQPDSITLCNDAPARTLEGLPLERRVARGQLPDSLMIELDGITHHLTPLEGQKTGFYLDQRENRLRLQGYVRNKRVLDGCCYEGAWGLYAAGFGASLVVGVDQSARALDRGIVNAQANGLDQICRFEQRNIFEYLKESEEQFDLIVLDPPAFAKSKGKLKQAERGYLDLNRRAIQSLGPGGILVTCSCSHHLKLERFQLLLSQAGRLARKRLRLLEIRGQARDHPVLLSMPETAYLKCLFLEVLDLE